MRRSDVLGFTGYTDSAGISKSLRQAIRIFLSIYLWAFILYQITPVSIIPYLNYSVERFYPKPLLYTYSFAYDVKTAFSHHAGSIKNLKSALKEKGFDVVIGDFPDRIGFELLPMKENDGCKPIRSSQVSLFHRLANFFLESLPSRLLGSPDFPTLTKKRFPKEGKCFLLYHDRRVFFSTFWGFQVPSYVSILGEGRNMFFSREPLVKEIFSEDFLRAPSVSFGHVKVRFFAYSKRSFYLPGEKTHYPFNLVVETDCDKCLVRVIKDGKEIGIYPQRRVSLQVKEPGSYRVEVIRYAFRIGDIFFGIRTLFLSSPIEKLRPVSSEGPRIYRDRIVVAKTGVAEIP